MPDYHRIPIWKKWLSYLWDISLDESVSLDGAPLKVSLSRGRLLLSASNAIYSFDDLYINFREAFLEMDKTLDEGESILILGMGLGAIPYMLEKMSGLKFHFILVEIDPNVIHLATKYSLPRLRSGYAVICTDAFTFMAENTRKFDLICMDVFVDDIVPENLETATFLQWLNEALSPDGLILFNRLYHYTRDRIATDAFEKNIFSTVFPDYGYLEVEGNRVFFSQKKYLKS